MVLFGRRLLSRGEITLIFTAVFLPVQFWMLYNVLLAVPSYLLWVSTWDMLGFIAYTQAFALFESLLVFAGLAVMVFLAPVKWRSERLVAGLGALIFCIVLWSIWVHLEYENIVQLRARETSLWVLIILSTSILWVGLITRNSWATAAMISVLERASVLTALYLAIDVFCVIVVGLRNLMP